MIPSPIYTRRYYAEKLKVSLRRGLPETISKAIMALGTFNSVIELGCASGVVLKALSDIGIDIYGVDFGEAGCCLTIPADKFLLHDLRTPLQLDKKFDLCLSLETAEHLEPEYADIFVQNMINCSDKIMLSASPDAHHTGEHLNPQPRSYWIQKFSDKGYSFDKNKTELWQQTVGRGARMIPYRNNAMYFERIQ